MVFEKAFRLSSYGLLLSGFTALFASQAVGLFLAVGYFLAVIGSWKRRGIALSNLAQVLIFTGLILVFAVDAKLISDPVSATVRILILASLVKLYSRKAERDYLILYFISFGFLLFASAYTISIAFLASLMVYIFISILTFILFESKKAYEENRSADFSLRGYVNVALVITSLITLISIPIFLVIPRSALGLSKVDRNWEINLSGFSDKVSLGDIGKIINNSKIVMRAKIDIPKTKLPPDLKWRGIGLDHYDGEVWSNTREGVTRLRRAPGYQGMLVAENRRHNEFLVQQSILLEPFSRIVFGVPEIILVTGEMLPKRYAFRDSNGSINVYRRAPGLLKYVVFSDIMTREEKMAMPMEGSIPERIRIRCLQLPELDPRLHQLAEEVTQGEYNPVKKALAIESFLKGSFTYSLDNLSAVADDPIVDFLFETKAGHCEYFAVAQALMMRSIGIPSRLVNGFRLGEFNEFSDYFVVRQSDAHSWVEGYFPGPGWMEFDSTPWIVPSEKALTLSNMISQIFDAIDIFWTEIVTFDRVKQVGFFRSLRENISGAWRTALDFSFKSDFFAKTRWFDWFKDWNFSGFIYLGLIFLIALLSFLGHRYRFYLKAFWKRRVLRQESFKIAPEYYQEMLEVLGRRGWLKGRGETPGEFAHRIETDVGISAPHRITELYYHSRFGHYPLTPSNRSKINGWLKDLR